LTEDEGRNLTGDEGRKEVMDDEESKCRGRKEEEERCVLKNSSLEYSMW
jgi:hypothetical protein